ncbi:uncharacterized protein LOC110644450 [Hevea brasiliensis]|uniref:uncharacterized protein LOC110644450 n=1 Tax=Hevea brasiliensis TaxID=3981 RepID=UPI0025CD9AB5|nr:uncharacterized protein LOC110644450 [Hevea brasiliensis]
MEDVFKAHLSVQKVMLFMAGGEVPEWMRCKNKIGSSLSFKIDLRHLIAFSFCIVTHFKHYGYLPERFECGVDFIYESGNRQEHNKFTLFNGEDFANWDHFCKGPYCSGSSHVLLSFNGLRRRFDEECLVKASFCFITLGRVYEQRIMECGVHPIYSRNKRRSTNEEHQDDEQPHQHQDDEKGEPPLQRLEQIEDQNYILNHERRKRKRKRKRKRTKIGHQNPIISIEKKHEDDDEGEPEDKEHNDLLNPEEDENQNDILNHERTKRKRKRKRKRMTVKRHDPHITGLVNMCFGFSLPPL